jgi:hypothetical protein
VDAVSDVSGRAAGFVDGLRTAAIYLRERRFWVPSRDPEPRRP